MNLIYKYLRLRRKSNFFLIAYLFCGFNPLFAQKKLPLHDNIWANKNHHIDGDAQEWKQERLDLNKESKLAYAIANNDSTLFILLKSTDKADLARLLRGEIKIGVNTDAEKKVKQFIGFPTAGSRQPRSQNSVGNKAQNQPDLNQELAQLNGILIGGFNELPDGIIARQNDYGIAVAAKLDQNGFLVWECALPMKLLQIDAVKNDIFALQIRINGLNLNANLQNRNFNRPMGMNSMGSAFPQRLPGSEGLEPSEFWILSRFAQAPKIQ